LLSGVFKAEILHREWMLWTGKGFCGIDLFTVAGRDLLRLVALYVHHDALIAEGQKPGRAR
jgi:hypothetical protein